MQTDVRRAVNQIGNQISEIRLIKVFRKTVISIPQFNQQITLEPTGNIAFVKISLPRIYLMYIETPQVKKLVFEYQVIHFTSIFLQKYIKTEL